MGRSEQPPRPKVLQLRPPVGPDEDVVEVCEKLLAMAKAGEICGIAYVATTPTRGSLQQWGGDETLTMLVGAAHELATTLTLASLSTFGDDDE